MAGTVLERQLTPRKSSGISFGLARMADDSEIRRLLRENPMPGRISLSLEREPSFFADAVVHPEKKQTIIARDNGQIVCVGSCAIRRRFVNGQSRTVGYLGGLRLDNRFSGRSDILRRGYSFFHQLQQESPADFYFTSIAADNERARTFLERGLPGMPKYEYLNEFVTLVLPTSGRRQSRPKDQKISSPGPLDDMFGFLSQYNSAYQFAPCWTHKDLIALHEPDSNYAAPTELRNWTKGARGYTDDALTEPFPALRCTNFYFLRCNRSIEACGALWDQRSFKQIVVRGYSKLVGWARPFLNAFSRLASGPCLPAIGETLSIAFASHLASKTDASLLCIIQHLSNVARQQGIELLTLGFASNDPRLDCVRKHFRCREYRSRIYLVHWPGIGGTARNLDNRVLAPEVALL